MIVSLFYLILAILGLSFLIFIHELGHYFVARREGMKVETFAIGFGQPIYSWMRDGVKWQIGWLPFGGFVRIAGTEAEEGQDPYAIKDGFFGKGPLSRIKVAFAGPLMNLIFALLAFAMIWLAGGRTASFTEHTHKIGWIDPKSELYAKGIRPGDEITAYDDRPFNGAKDHLYSSITASSQITVTGYKMSYATGERTPFRYTVNTEPHPSSLDPGILTSGITNSANYIIYDKVGGKENPISDKSPLKNSGIQYGDRILWVNGETVFSLEQLRSLLNDNKVLLTVERDGQTLLRRVPRVLVQELRLDRDFKEELIDWQFEANLNSIKLQNLYTVPYNLTNDAQVEEAARFIDKENQDGTVAKQAINQIEEPLKVGDKIIAVNGKRINHSSQLLKEVQKPSALIIVQNDFHPTAQYTDAEADAQFDKEIDWADLQKIVSTIGSNRQVRQAGELQLLNPIEPKNRSEILSPSDQELYNKNYMEKLGKVEKIQDAEKKNQAIRLLEKEQKELMIGLPAAQDKQVRYNPSPITMFYNVFDEIWRMLSAFASGSLNPKWLAGPIGIVQVVQEHSKVSYLDTLFWLGAISLNLGILNLLPIPVLDGGTILLSLIEFLTKKRLQPKTLEKLIIPFAILLIVFFVYLTYNDIMRIFSAWIGQ